MGSGLLFLQMLTAGRDFCWRQILGATAASAQGQVFNLALSEPQLLSPRSSRKSSSFRRDLFSRCAPGETKWAGSNLDFGTCRPEIPKPRSGLRSQILASRPFKA
jgi:hypothetical protein